MTTPQPNLIQPQPTPVSWTLGEARVPDGTTFAVVQLHLVTGTVTLFLAPSDFAKFADSMSEQAANLIKRPIIATSMPLLTPTPNGALRG